MMCMGVDFLWFILFGIHKPLDTWRFLSLDKFGQFSVINVFLALTLFFPPGTLVI